MEQNTYLRTALVTMTMLLAACSQQPALPESVTSSSNPPLAGSTPAPAELPGDAASSAFGLLTPTEAADQFRLDDLEVQMSGQALLWTAGLLDAQGHFRKGTLHAGTPLALTSPVRFAQVAASAAAADEGLLQGLTLDLIQFGDAALVPLLLKNGETVGLARLPLYTSPSVTSARVDYVLFVHPVAGIMTAQKAATAAGVKGAKVVAVASDAQGHYDPFNFHWLVAPAAKGERPTLVAPELPALVTQRGEFIPAATASLAPFSTSGLETSVEQAKTTFAVYTSSTSVTPAWTQK